MRFSNSTIILKLFRGGGGGARVILSQLFNTNIMHAAFPSERLKPVDRKKLDGEQPVNNLII